ncbi:TetR/AcrR family transcriptional regulator [Cohnella sp. JJ-181]|uniref:TetR/AcrR family transcriptional regulator n=1 Tax=Cohnella rhizoplanae TaxID=2974897 RepID=UPI00232B2D7B|nr:TetR/AcrR family transcriptional regulator [Cohnella sp. JJ-181]
MARSKEFEENAVLDKAMRLFWEQGYEKTSMNDLVERMGIHRRSLYDTFTDKRTLFLKAIDRFEARMGARLKAAIKQSPTAAQAMRAVFDAIIDGEPDAPAGCMLVNSAAELANRDAGIDAKIVEAFAGTERLLAEIVAWGQDGGEFTRQYEAGALAAYLHNALAGLRVMTRTSADKDKLRQIAGMSMLILEP